MSKQVKYSKEFKLDALNLLQEGKSISEISNDNKAEIRFKINDIFNSWSPQNMKTRFDNQNLNMHMLPDSRYVSLSFSYKFGGFKEKKHKEVDTSRFGAK